MLHCPEVVRSLVLNAGFPVLSELAGALSQGFFYEIRSDRLEG